MTRPEHRDELEELIVLRMHVAHVMLDDDVSIHSRQHKVCQSIYQQAGKRIDQLLRAVPIPANAVRGDPARVSRVSPFLNRLSGALGLSQLASPTGSQCTKPGRASEKPASAQLELSI